MSASAPDFPEVLAFFKALSDESRLKIVGALSSSERSVDELALMLNLRAPTVSHHLVKLKEIDLVSKRVDGNTHYYSLKVQAMHDLSKRVLALDTVNRISKVVNEDVYEQKVLRDFLDGMRIKEIPASLKKRKVILRWLCRFFDADKRYSEKEVNAIISRHHSDFATLRREFICNKLMDRGGGYYWRI